MPTTKTKTKTKTNTKTNTRTNYRSTDTGEYTTKKYAIKHPKTTVKETNKVVIKKKPSSVKKHK